jgi:subtilisin family serine protease
MSINQCSKYVRQIFFVMFATLLTFPVAIETWSDGTGFAFAQQGAAGDMNRTQIKLWNDTLPLDLAEIEQSDEAKEATNQTIITLRNSSSSPDAVASLAGSAVESGLEVEQLPLTGNVIVNGTEEDVVGAQAGRGSRPLPAEKSGVWIIASQSIPTGVDRIDAERRDTNQDDTTEGPATNAVIGIVDTGIDPNHPDLNVDLNLSRNFADLHNQPESNWTDYAGHGTHVAGIAAAKDNAEGVVGVAPGAKVVAIKVLNDEGWGTTKDILEGLEYVLANAGEFDAINISIGGHGSSDAINRAIRQIVDAGVPVVVAAGNEYDDASFYGPASADDAITVSASYDGDGKCGGLGPSTYRYIPNTGEILEVTDDSFAPFSNYGPRVDIIAPGTNINSTVPVNSTLLPNSTGYDVYSGTSMAAPHVAGAVALLKSIFPQGLEGDSASDTVKGWSLEGQGFNEVRCDAFWEDGFGTLANWTKDGDPSHEPHLYLGRAG